MVAQEIREEKLNALRRIREKKKKRKKKGYNLLIIKYLGDIL
jgi:hypothetical protein